ncbi:amino acid ABC transporter permease [Streptomyces sp. NPDC057217]|uniref:amino acid ABC transporter permease n=1 Tax=Streptomyces sp. NPDC057217 TaxID=3346054 RepID=UPI0036310993
MAVRLRGRPRAEAVTDRPWTSRKRPCPTRRPRHRTTPTDPATTNSNGSASAAPANAAAPGPPPCAPSSAWWPWEWRRSPRPAGNASTACPSTASRAPGLQPPRLAAAVYVFRGVPTLLLVFLIGFGLPALRLQGTPSEPWVLGVIALVLSYAAYVGEVLRAGLNSVHPAQRNAARALGLDERQTLRHVVLPQAVRNVLPPLLNDFIALQKGTALVAVLGPLEVLRAAQIKADYDFNHTPYPGAALLFLAVTIPLTRFADRLQRRAARRTWAGADR